MISCLNLIKDFGNPPQRVLHDLSFKIDDGEFVSISGRSGSGKSTLLYLISSLDMPTDGVVFIDGLNLKDLNSQQIHRLRNEKIGFIFQFHYLLPELTAMENILLPARNLKLIDKKKNHALDLLKKLGIEHLTTRYPNQLSGGEQQRVAIARALILNPKYLFADEPTGNLDTINAQIVMDILKEVNERDKTTVCLVTHDPDFASMAKREIYLIDGKISKKESELSLNR